MSVKHFEIMDLLFPCWWLFLWNVSMLGTLVSLVNTSPYILVSCGFVAKDLLRLLLGATLLLSHLGDSGDVSKFSVPQFRCL